MKERKTQIREEKKKLTKRFYLFPQCIFSNQRQLLGILWLLWISLYNSKMNVNDFLAFSNYFKFHPIPCKVDPKYSRYKIHVLHGVR